MPIVSFTYSHSWPLAASPPEVFAALTKVTQLRRWFSTHAEVTTRKGGKYCFWGKHTLGAPGKKEATQRVTAIDRDRSLAFSWTIHGIPTAVAIGLRPAPKGTVLDLSHEVKGELPVPRQREYIDDFWRLQIGNLAMHLAGGAGIVRPDFTDPVPEVRTAITIKASPDAVFRALTEPALVNEWFGSTRARVAAVPGGEYWVGWEYKVDGRDVIGGTTRILHIVPGRKLVLDWLDWRGDASMTGQYIGFTLAASGKRTKLRFVHGGFSRTADLGDYPFGWVYFLEKLKSVAERVTP